MDRGAWQATVHGVENSWTQLNDSHTHTHTHTHTHLGLGLPGGLVEKIHLPMQETRVLSLGQEDPLEKEMETHSSILAWEIPWTEGAWRPTVHRVTKSWT